MGDKQQSLDEELHAAAFEVARIGICFVDESGHFVGANPEFCRMLGAPEDGIVGKHWTIVAPDELLLGHKRFLAALFEDSPTVPTEWRIRRVGGAYVEALVSFKTLVRGNGQRCVAITFSDITERKSAELRLAESEARFRLIAETTGDMIALVDLDGIRQYNNAAYRVLLGDPDSLVGTNSFFDIHVEDRERIQDAFRRTVATALGQRAEYRLVARTGKIRYIESQSNVISDASGLPQQVVVVSRDVTERRLAEEELRASEAEHREMALQIRDLNADLENRIEARTVQLRSVNAELESAIAELRRTQDALRESEERYRLIIDTATDAVVSIDAAGVVSGWNVRAENQFGYSREDALGQRLSTLIMPQALRHGHERALERFVLTGRSHLTRQPLELTALRRDGTEFPVEISVWPVNSSGKLFFSAFLRDITERKRAEQEIVNALKREKELSELKSRFVSMTSHEFRTPLATILSSVELLEDYADRLPDSERVELSGMIKQAVRSMTRMLDQVLTIGRGDAGRIDFAPLSVDPAEFCARLVDEIRRGLSDPLRLVCRFETQARSIPLDAVLLRHALTNLVENALKYSALTQPVQVNLRDEGQFLVIDVRDNGIGIPQEDQDRLFQTFHRARNVGNISGTGLGLSIAKEAIKLHRGTLTFRSQLGVGTCFTICLPCTLSDGNGGNDG